MAPMGLLWQWNSFWFLVASRVSTRKRVSTNIWWSHNTVILSALLVFCAGNSRQKGPPMQIYDGPLLLTWTGVLNKEPRGLWDETPNEAELRKYAPVQCQGITWTNADLLSIGPIGTNFSGIGKKNAHLFIHVNAFEPVVSKMAASLSRP